jgi:hypothetical protein
MISLDVLTQQSLFSLLHQIDFDLAEQTKARRCPIVEDRYIMPITGVNHGAVLLIFKGFLIFVTACAAAVKAVVVVLCRHLSGFGDAGFIGRPWCFCSPPFARGNIQTLHWSGSRDFAGYGDPPLIAGETILFKFFLTVAIGNAFQGMS